MGAADQPRAYLSLALSLEKLCQSSTFGEPGFEGDAFITDSFGRIVFHQDRSKVGQNFRLKDFEADDYLIFPQTLMGGLLHLTVIASKEKIQKSVSLVASLSSVIREHSLEANHLFSETQKRRIRFEKLAWLIIITTLVLAISSVFWVTRRVSLTIAHLSSVAEQIALCNLEAEPLPHLINHGDELGLLARNINQMRLNLKEQIGVLDLRVEEKTKELQSSNLKLRQEISERKKAEEELSTSEEKYRELVTCSLDGVVSADSMMNITLWNRAAERIFGYSDKEIIGQSLIKIVPEKYHQRVEEGFQFFRQTGTGKVIGKTFEVEGLKKDGQIIPVELSISSKKKEEICLAIAVVRDISERKYLQNKLLQISEQEQIRIGHDLHDGLGQHLTGTNFLCKALEQQIASGYIPEASEVAEIGKLINQAITIVRNQVSLLHPVNLEADGLMTALKDLAFSVKNLFNVSCQFLCEHPVLIHDNIKAIHLYRIAQEAIHNAVKHSQAKHITLSLTLVDDRFALTIEDDGLGLSKTADNKCMGLRIMNYRAGMIGALLDFKTEPGFGTKVVCSAYLSD